MSLQNIARPTYSEFIDGLKITYTPRSWQLPKVILNGALDVNKVTLIQNKLNYGPGLGTLFTGTTEINHPTLEKRAVTYTPQIKVCEYNQASARDTGSAQANKDLGEARDAIFEHVTYEQDALNFYSDDGLFNVVDPHDYVKETAGIAIKTSDDSDTIYNTIWDNLDDAIERVKSAGGLSKGPNGANITIYWAGNLLRKQLNKRYSSDGMTIKERINKTVLSDTEGVRMIPVEGTIFERYQTKIDESAQDVNGFIVCANATTRLYSVLDPQISAVAQTRGGVREVYGVDTFKTSHAAAYPMALKPGAITRVKFDIT